MKMLDLCSGIAGISMAADWVGIETVAFCEIEGFNQRVLRKNYPNIPIFPDLYKLTKQSLIDGGVDVDLNGVVSAGYPCQGESLVGKRRGAEDERWLWPEVFRLIKELRPTWFVGENVAGHVTMGLDTVLSDLEEENYSTRTFVFPAVSVGAPHQRYRTFIVGYSNDKSKLQADPRVVSFRSKRETWENTTGINRGILSRRYWEENKPAVCGMDDGTATRLDEDRLRFLGNAVVPQ
ncbi:MULTISPECIES: DNA cytosine methyltransferase [Bacillus cereus group]|uniref:DNA cytosine methyltransferase n=1 Tax=Bacillus cereus group TaxID=86661 RepID=UPI0010BDCCC8|nr:MULTISPECIES: DNA cytosine methyltransferase [Bacillus cereus group]MCU5454756.1 DNA cytosine methyltransferase [Bacillus cereus]MCU5548965.1 DNA cytosine methyltransferase [Bacillus cereus]MCU5680054.1 DNA cytosine methyltransferase [Bacillus cereus]TKH81166.1 DNA (cytosine-5-)-methyltransferase [Bacillus cereus]HDR6388567.1 DNA cytosine methyltransferase [Bacillus cereus]